MIILESEPLFFVCLFIIFLMLYLPDDSRGFLEHPDTSSSFQTLSDDSLCFMLLVDAPCISSKPL